MKITTKARGTDIDKKLKVFLCYDKNNVNERDTVVEDLLSMDAGLDCAVTYLEGFNGLDEAVLLSVFEKCNMLVVWVTRELLQTIENNSRNLLEYCMAKSLEEKLKGKGLPPISILPILSDESLFDDYNSAFNAIHCINMSDGWDYRDKLQFQMDTLMRDNDMAKQINEKAFSSMAFIGYRKTELAYLKNFRNVFYGIDGFEAITTWYDHSLEAGRNFNDDIKEIINRCDVFVLMVTPNLATEGNYVQSKEYPYVQEKGKQVIAIEVIKTCPVEFEKHFPNAGKLIPLDDISTIEAAFRDKLPTSVFEKPDSERTLLRGLASLQQIGIAQNVGKGLKLLELVASKDSDMAAVKASEFLATLYENGMWVDVDYKKALKWSEMRAFHQEKLMGTNHPETAVAYSIVAQKHYLQAEYSSALNYYQKALDSCDDSPENHIVIHDAIAMTYAKRGDYHNAFEHHDNVRAILESSENIEQSIAITPYSNMAGLYRETGRYDESLKWYHNALSIFEHTVGVNHQDIALIYNEIAGVYDDQGNYEQALRYFHTALEMNKKNWSPRHPSIAMNCNNIGRVHSNMNDKDEALKWYCKALDIYQQTLGDEHPHTAGTYSNVACIYRDQGNFDKALELFRKAVGVEEKIYGTLHPELDATYGNIAVMYLDSGNFREALQWFLKCLRIARNNPELEHLDAQGIESIMESIYPNAFYSPSFKEWLEQIL